jgi:DNA-binding GntR family transcriptional regulator
MRHMAPKDLPPANQQPDGKIKTYQRPATALESVLAEIRRELVSGELRPGQRVMQDALSERLNVSRVPVREALHILHGEGRLTHLPNYGYYALSLSPADLRELVQARSLLEDAVVERSLTTLSDDDIRSMMRISDEMKTFAEKGETDEFQRLNRAFHSALVGSAQMPHFMRLIDTLWDSVSPYVRLYFADSESRSLVHQEHSEIIEAARRKDKRQLLKLLRQHRAHAISAVIAKLEEADPPPPEPGPEPEDHDKRAPD